MYTDNSFIRLDWAAKNILRDKADYEIFEGLLTVLFKEKVKIIELLESESNKDKEDAKYNRVDIKAKNSKDEIILVEIQLDHDTYYLERILFGVSKTIAEHIGQGQNYQHVKKVYSINILYFNLGIGTDYLYHGTNEFVGVNTGDTLLFNQKGKKRLGKKRRHNIFPEYYIIRVENFEKEKAETPMEEWMLYMKTGYISPNTTAPGLQKARERLRVLSMSDEVRRKYEKYLYNMVYEKDIVETAREDGWSDGYDAGEAHILLKTIQALKARGIDYGTIADITGLSEDEIPEFIRSMSVKTDISGTIDAKELMHEHWAERYERPNK